MATKVRALWLFADRARFPCNERTLLARCPRHIQSMFNLIVSIYVMFNWQLSKMYRPCHMTVSLGQVYNSLRWGVFYWPSDCEVNKSRPRLISGTIECFHSRGQHLCKFIGTKESVCIIKEFNSQRFGLGHQHGSRFVVLGHQYGHHDVMWKHSIIT